MPTAEEISTAASALRVSIDADTATLEGWQDAAARAAKLDATAAVIEAAGYVRCGTTHDDRVKMAAPTFVSGVVSDLRARATSIRDAVVLP